MTWCGSKKLHFSHTFHTSDGFEVECVGYEPTRRSHAEPDEEFVWPEDDEDDYERTV